jgi:predicted  nucleic acid-binding Zn-ribbon protein
MLNEDRKTFAEKFNDLEKEIETLKSNTVLLKDKLLEAKPELKEWLEKHFD